VKTCQLRGWLEETGVKALLNLPKIFLKSSSLRKREANAGRRCLEEEGGECREKVFRGRGRRMPEEGVRGTPTLSFFETLGNLRGSWLEETEGVSCFCGNKQLRPCGFAIRPLKGTRKW
jgi:hypothetical protein